jgi:hypothetical protein
MSDRSVAESYRTSVHAAAADAVRRAVDEAFNHGRTVKAVTVKVESWEGEPDYPAPAVIETRNGSWAAS